MGVLEEGGRGGVRVDLLRFEFVSWLDFRFRFRFSYLVSFRVVPNRTGFFFSFLSSIHSFPLISSHSIPPPQLEGVK